MTAACMKRSPSGTGGDRIGTAVGTTPQPDAITNAYEALPPSPAGPPLRPGFAVAAPGLARPARHARPGWRIGCDKARRNVADSAT